MSELKVAEFAERLIENIETVIVGKHDQIRTLVIALLCRGHVLVEDVPGTGKTMLARAVAASLAVDFKRLQCTPDLLPSDVVGTTVYNQASGTFEFHEGPVFVGVLLADEINRATPRTQSALLEAMQERQVTADGVSRPLPDPFLVLATQNPVEYEGTFPLPEAQLDRFLIRLSLGYPTLEEEVGIIDRVRHGHPIESVRSVAGPEELAEMADRIQHVHLDPDLAAYAVRLVQATRDHRSVTLGASPRAAIALAATARARAVLDRRDFVLPDDIKAMTRPVLGHRLVVSADAALRGVTADDVVAEIVAGVDVPVIDG